tara:strand:- start:1339 stop:1902 length:564 start_codon:yes stop_codon:yes gene_type:complete
MRIISGELKGRKIFEPPDRTTRPLKDLVKESIFNIVMHSNKISIDLKNSNILDLFSGVGSFGIEALSRGSKYVTFIENYTEVLQILRKNIQKLNLDNKCEIISEDIINKLNFKKLNKKFELIFLDPPFDEKNLSKILLKIYDSKILKKNGILIIHRKINTDDKLIPKFNIIEEKKYGLSKIMFGNYL